MLLMQVVLFGIGITKPVNNALLDGSSIIFKNVFLSIRTVKNGIIREPVLLVMLVIFFKEEAAHKETHFVKQAIQMAPAQAAILAIFWIMEVVCLSQNWLT
jgi:hypothetical protein